MIKGTTKSLFVFFVDGNGNPRENLDITKIKFRVYYCDRSSAEENDCDIDNGGGFYSFAFTDTRHKDFVYTAHYSGNEGEFNSDYFREPVTNDPLECVAVGSYKLYGRAQVNGVDTSGVRVRIFTSDLDIVRETSSGSTLYHYPPDSSKYYNWMVYLEDPGTYVVELWKAGYITGTWSITITNTSSYFEDLIAS